MIKILLPVCAMLFLSACQTYTTRVEGMSPEVDFVASQAESKLYVSFSRLSKSEQDDYFEILSSELTKRGVFTSVHKGSNPDHFNLLIAPKESVKQRSKLSAILGFITLTLIPGEEYWSKQYQLAVWSGGHRIKSTLDLDAQLNYSLFPTPLFKDHESSAVRLIDRSYPVTIESPEGKWAIINEITNSVSKIRKEAL